MTGHHTVPQALVHACRTGPDTPCPPAVICIRLPCMHTSAIESPRVCCEFLLQRDKMCTDKPKYRSGSGNNHTRSVNGWKNTHQMCTYDQICCHDYISRQSFVTSACCDVCAHATTLFIQLLQTRSPLQSFTRLRHAVLVRMACGNMQSCFWDQASPLFYIKAARIEIWTRSWML